MNSSFGLTTLILVITFFSNGKTIDDSVGKFLSVPFLLSFPILPHSMAAVEAEFDRHHHLLTKVFNFKLLTLFISFSVPSNVIF